MSICPILTDFGDQLKSPGGGYDVIPRAIARRISDRIEGRFEVVAAGEGMVLELGDSGFEIVMHGAE